MTEYLDTLPKYMLDHLKNCSVCGEKFVFVLNEIQRHIPEADKP